MVRLNDDAPDAAALLAEAGRSGLLVWREGDRLRIRGPVAAAALARRLLADKPAALSVLDARDDPTPRGSRWNRAPTPWCDYGHPAGWRSVFGPHLICATCHPPADPAAVAGRVDARGGGSAAAPPPAAAHGPAAAPSPPIPPAP